MKIVVASALFPPDVSEPAPYTKELICRLSATDKVTGVVYGHLPEPVPAAATLVDIDKRAPAPVRLARFTYALWQAVRRADVLYIINGSSVELPALIARVLTQKPLVIYCGDTNASRGMIHRIASLVASTVIDPAASSFPTPAPKPEILPFAPKPSAALAQYEHSWTAHLKALRRIFSTYVA